MDSPKTNADYLFEAGSELEFKRPQFELAALRPLVPNLRRIVFIAQKYIWRMWEDDGFTKEELQDIWDGIMDVLRNDYEGVEVEIQDEW